MFSCKSALKYLKVFKVFKVYSKHDWAVNNEYLSLTSCKTSSSETQFSQTKSQVNSKPIGECFRRDVHVRTHAQMDGPIENIIPPAVEHKMTYYLVV